MWLLQGMGERLARPAGWIQRAFRQSPPAFRRGVALLFRFAGNVASEFWSTFWPFAVFAALAFVLLLNESGVYQSILRYTGIYQGVRVASATAIAAGGLFIADFAAGELLGLRPVPLSVILAGAGFGLLPLVAGRVFPRGFFSLSPRG